VKHVFGSFNQIELAYKHFSLGNYEQAELLCNQILQENPKDSDAYFILANCQHKRGKSNEAIILFNKCIGFNPSYVNAYCSIAAIYGEQNNIEESEKVLQKGLNDNEESLVILMNLALNYEGQKKYQEAILTYNRILQKDPNHFESYNNLGNCYKELGEYSYSFTAFMKAKMVKPNSEVVNNNLAALFFAKGEFNKIIKFYQDIIEQSPLNSYIFNMVTAVKIHHDVEEWYDFLSNYFDNQKFADHKFDVLTKSEIIITKAISCYVRMDYEKCRHYITKFAELNKESSSNEICNSKNYQSNFGFFVFLDKLLGLSNKESQIIAEKMEIIGDSHSLSYSGKIVKFANQQYQVRPHLVTGCKMWHLADERDNPFKRVFEKKFEFLPKGAKIIVSLGEIDLRIGEGIFRHAKEHNLEIQQVMEYTVSNYIKFMLKLRKNENEIIIASVPAPNNLRLLETLSQPEQQSYLMLVKEYNSALKKQAEQNKFLYIDFYAMTLGDNLVSNRKYHLEEIHLMPDSLQIGIDNFISKNF